MYTTQLTNSCRHLRTLTALSYKYSPILASQTNRCLSGRAHLRSAERHDISVPSTRTQLGRQSFHVAAPAVWNVLPSQLRSSSISRGQFKAGLKTHLFTQAYTDSSENFCSVLLERIILHYITLAVWLSGNALASINVVALCQTRLVLGRVTVCGRVNHVGM